MKKIVIIGAGSMGSAFTLPCVDNRNRTFLIGTHLEDKLINNLKKNYLHPLLKTKLPKKLTIEKFNKLDSIIKDAGKPLLFNRAHPFRSLVCFKLSQNKAQLKNRPLITSLSNIFTK